MRAIIVIFSANPLEDNVASKDNGSVSDGYLVLTVLVLPAEFQAGLGCLEETLNKPAISVQTNNLGCIQRYVCTQQAKPTIFTASVSDKHQLCRRSIRCRYNY